MRQLDVVLLVSCELHFGCMAGVAFASLKKARPITFLTWHLPNMVNH